MKVMHFETALRLIVFGMAIQTTAACVRTCGSLADLAPRDVPFCPPRIVFRVVWLILYGTTGAAWAISRRDVPFAMLTFLCCWWLVAYVCLRQKTLALATLVASEILTGIMIGALWGTAGQLLVPQALWLGVATYLNAYEVIRSIGRE